MNEIVIKVHVIPSNIAYNFSSMSPTPQPHLNFKIGIGGAWEIELKILSNLNHFEKFRFFQFWTIIQE